MNKKQLEQSIGWIAATFTGVGILFLGGKNVYGWLIGIFGNMIWIAYGVSIKQKPIVGVNIILFTTQLVGLLQWLKVLNFSI